MPQSHTRAINWDETVQRHGLEKAHERLARAKAASPTGGEPVCEVEYSEPVYDPTHMAATKTHLSPGTGHDVLATFSKSMARGGTLNRVRRDAACHVFGSAQNAHVRRAIGAHNCVATVAHMNTRMQWLPSVRILSPRVLVLHCA